MLENSEWKPELRFIQSVLKKTIYGGNPKDITSLLQSESLDWKNLQILLTYHELTPFVYLAVKPYRHLLADSIYESLHNHYWISAKNNLLKEKEYKILHDAFQREKVGLVPIKGIALMWHLHTRYSTVRPMTDIDVLIREEDYGKAVEILEGMEYTKSLSGLTEDYWRNKQCHVAFSRQERASYHIRVEVHFRLDLRRNKRGILPLVWERRRSLEVDGKSILLLSPEDTLFSLALHQRRFGKMFCLKYALDTALLLRKHDKEFDWDYVFGECKKHDLFTCVYFLLLQVKLFAGNNISSIMESSLFCLPERRKQRMARFISKEMNTLNPGQRLKENYLKAHFLLYDSPWEPVGYILKIPQEQFADFYGLKPYDSRTALFYRFRFLYIILRWAAKFFRQPERVGDKEEKH